MRKYKFQNNNINLTCYSHQLFIKFSTLSKFEEMISCLESYNLTEDINTLNIMIIGIYDYISWDLLINKIVAGYGRHKLFNKVA